MIVFLSRELKLTIEELEVSIISGKKLLEINRTFLNHDFETDIITFQYGKSKKKLSGELLISLDDAKRNAKKFSVALRSELFRLLVHGILHLAGFDDKRAVDRRIMINKQEKLLKNYFTESNTKIEI